MSAAPVSLSPELARLDLLLHREILRLRTRYELSLDEFRGLYVSDQQVDELLNSHRHDAENNNVRELGGRAEVLLREIDTCEQQVTASTRWVQLARRLELSRAERDTLLLTLAPDLDAKYEILYAYLNNDVTCKLPSLELSARLFANTPQERANVRHSMAPSSTFAGLGVLEFVPSSLEMPLAQRGLRIAQPLIDWLLGFEYEDERLREVCRASPIAASSPYPKDGDTGRLLSLISQSLAAGDEVPPIIIRGETAAQSVFTGVTLLKDGGRECTVLALDALAASSNPLELARAVGLMSRVLNRDIVATPLEASRTPEGAQSPSAASALGQLCRSGSNLVLAGSRLTGTGPALTESLRTIEIELPELTVAARVMLWRDALDGEGSNLPIEALADRFMLGADRIAQAVQMARDRALINNTPLQGADLFAASRTVSGHNIEGAETTRIRSTLEWEDLILPAVAQRRLQDVLDMVRNRHCVLDQWGFGRRMNGARGVKALFSGASGTGKTMAATLIAQRLGFDLHRIEIAAVVSKYIGETEKNLDRAFDTARRANAILFIDEADALFGKRSEVKDAHDRYANVETAYLLQKMEDHDGVVILATNLVKNIDESFSRRMQFVIEFPVPDASNRERLWHGMFPPGAPVADDVDFGFLARQFELTGGAICNIVLEAAYAAAANGSRIDMRHLLRALAQEYKKRSKVPSQAEFGEYLPLLAQVDDYTHPANLAHSASNGS